jgi:hypothetical protein
MYMLYYAGKINLFDTIAERFMNWTNSLNDKPKKGTDMYETLKRVIDTYGDEAQLIVAVEELSELTKAITKHLRGKGDPVNIAEEIADVEIMLEQLKLIFPYIVDDIEEWKQVKIERIDCICDEADRELLTNINDRM